VFSHPAFPEYSMRYKKPALCDPDVKQVNWHYCYLPPTTTVCASSNSYNLLIFFIIFYSCSEIYRLVVILILIPTSTSSSGSSSRVISPHLTLLFFGSMVALDAVR
jgi:hypothetical protein